MDFKVVFFKGLIVLDRVIDYFDIEVIWCMFKKEYREKCGVIIFVFFKYLELELFINNEIRNIIEDVI